MLKQLLKATQVTKSSGLFVGGVLFGTVGLKLLSSKNAKAKYAKVIAKSYQVKDELDSSLSVVKQHTDDVLADAREIYEAKKQKELALSAEELELDQPSATEN
ncbi:DUF6110 family protein [Streptococcus marimammalium]|uniref:DUF6110 family protein n=1 Tax=Streptococcus marimammalium TaxID=269666 RepID=UPI0003634E12|nr:DUF6110 family protein [Streptococcus marimammalium]